MPTVSRQECAKFTRVRLVAAFAAGVIFPLIFFSIFDPDRADLTLFSVLLVVTAAVICAKGESTFPLNATAAGLMLLGFPIGVSLAAIIYTPEKANIFPIAAVIWTIIAIIPVRLGAILGPLFKKLHAALERTFQS